VAQGLKVLTASLHLSTASVMKVFIVALYALAASAHTPNIVELAESVTDLSTLVAAVVAGDLVDTLSSPGPFTVFAPTNEGFGKLPAGTLDSLMKPENKDQLVDILTYHVLAEKVLSTDLKLRQGVATVEGRTLQVFKNSNGVRVTPDGKDFKSVTSADNEASNGVVHIIDGVLIPTTLPNIVELAESQEILSTLVAAVVAGDLVETLSSPRAFIFFAPTNEAFAALPTGVLDDLMKPESKAKLVDILTNHVFADQGCDRRDVSGSCIVNSLGGKTLAFYSLGAGFVVRLCDGPCSYESCNCGRTQSVIGTTFPTARASNGDVNVIDGVLLSPTSPASTTIV